MYLPTSNIINRTFRIRCGQLTGTAFTLDVEGRQYFVTAKHVLAAMIDGEQLHIFSNDSWLPIKVDLVGHSSEIDISVVAPRQRLTPNGLPLTPDSNGLTYGQDVFFLGFPYDFLGGVAFTEEGYPLPFVKRATVSNWSFSKNALDILYLDGHNNVGFSGGPVVFFKPNDTTLRVAAVVSSYKAEPEPVYLQDKKTPLAYLDNTGIIVSHGQRALDLIRLNPIGLPLD